MSASYTPDNQAHSLHGHITSLSDQDPSLNYSNKIINQSSAVESLSFLKRLIDSKNFSGSLISISGPSSSSKSVLASTLSSELGDQYPFIEVSATELSDFEDSESSKNFLISRLRSAIGIRLREVKELYEGELVSVSSIDPENENSTVEIVLKSAAGTRKITLDAYSSLAFLEQKIRPGDIVLIEIGAGSVIKLGRCDVYATEYDLECERFIPLPKGDVYRRQLGVKDVTLSEVDRANSEIASEFEAPEKLSYKLGKRKAFPNDSLLREIDKTIRFYESRKNARVYPGILCVKDAHLLSEKVMGRLVSCGEYKKWAPTILLVSSRPLEILNEEYRNKIKFVMTEENSFEDIKEISLNKLRANGLNEKDIELIGMEKIEQWSKESGSANYVVQMANLVNNGLDVGEIGGCISGKEYLRNLEKD